MQLDNIVGSYGQKAQRLPGKTRPMHKACPDDGGQNARCDQTAGEYIPIPNKKTFEQYAAPLSSLWQLHCLRIVAQFLRGCEDIRCQRRTVLIQQDAVPCRFIKAPVLNGLGGVHGIEHQAVC